MADLGKKRRCAECEAAFYDLNRDPITCPKCGAVHQPPVARLKSDGRTPPKGRSFPKRQPVAEPALEPAAAGAASDTIEDDLDPAEGDAEDDNEDDDKADETDDDPGATVADSDANR